MDPKTEFSEGNGYSPFNTQLDGQFPVKSLKLNEESRKLVVEGKIEPLQWVSLFRNSPARNMEAEVLMGEIVTAAVRANQWVDIPEPTEDQEFGPVTVEKEGMNITIAPFSLQFIRAAHLLYEHGLAKRVADQQGRNYLKPTEQLIQFFGQRIGFVESQ